MLEKIGNGVGTLNVCFRLLSESTFVHSAEQRWHAGICFFYSYRPRGMSLTVSMKLHRVEIRKWFIICEVTSSPTSHSFSTQSIFKEMLPQTTLRRTTAPLYGDVGIEKGN